MANYRSKSDNSKVEAWQSPLSWDEFKTEEIMASTGCKGWEASEDGLVVPCFCGDVMADHGDWIVKGADGEYFTYNPREFSITYVKDNQ